MNRLAFLLIPLSALPCACSEAVAPGPDEPGAAGIRLETVATGLASPVLLTAPPGDARLFVVEQGGRIRVIDASGLKTRPFLDITDLVSSGGERGLLGLAFSPDYATTGEFVVDYTDRSGNTRVERYAVSADPDSADPGSARIVLSVQQPFSNHNGGLVTFGPDGMLYIGLGDGGGAGDPRGNGQNPGTLLGTILRLDLSSEPYAIPPDNPFSGVSSARGEIWAYGLRNPWRYSFDRVAGLLYIADVGQNQYEEVNVVGATTPGLNFGWNRMEGMHCYGTASCDTAGLSMPALEYDHGQGCSVTGGFVYRGSDLPGAAGLYFYSDYCSGWIRSFRYVAGQATERRDWGLDAGRVLSFGEDARGELYVLNAAGTVYRLVPTASASD